MDSSEQKVSINYTPVETVSNGFDILVTYHRISGILYLGYGRSQKRLYKLLLIVWGLFVLSLTTILNTPCLVHCFLDEKIYSGKFAFFLFNFIFGTSTANNIFSTIVISRRGRAFNKLIKSLNRLISDRKSLRKQKILTIIMVTYSVILVIIKIILVNGVSERISYHHLIRASEDFFSEVMADTITFLLIYFSNYITIAVEELNASLKDKFKKNEIDFDGIHQTIIKIQKIIKKANNLLSPCLILVFITNIFFIVTFWFLIENMADHAMQNKFIKLIPLLSLYIIRLFFCCMFVDRMNVKVTNPMDFRNALF